MMAPRGSAQIGGSKQMDAFQARTVFFVRDTPGALAFYTGALGFTQDWAYEEQGRPLVAQVSLHGMAIILNQQEGPADTRAGHGRLFVGLDDAQTVEFLKYIQVRKIEATYTEWGEPTLAIPDLDGNELFFWLSDSERAKLRAAQEGGG
jgi:catechol 2,3-dioxygenase-like lactoylglutathione lyase family enzyme